VHNNRAPNFVEASFPKEAKTACHRKGSHHCENGISGVGFDGFKKVLDGSSHLNVSQRFGEPRHFRTAA
jgi:hypothetical protein